MTEPRIVDREHWLEAQRAHLDEEKALTRARDALSERRRRLPWLEITNDYRFDTTGGAKTLRELFAGRRQLLAYHFMFGRAWDEGCPSCSFWADNYDGLGIHLAHRDTTLIAVSSAPLTHLQEYRSRMGWEFEWVSSEGSTFNVDLGVSAAAGNDGLAYNFGTQHFDGDEAPGLSAFLLDDDRVFLTHQTFSRGLDLLNSAYHLLDQTALGRHEEGLPWSMAWLRRHDQYED